MKRGLQSGFAKGLIPSLAVAGMFDHRPAFAGSNAGLPPSLQAVAGSLQRY